jgi:crotonobetainyl-CoA:carnitine CoA-transferase CaiB-like acyl-CoA transferase
VGPRVGGVVDVPDRRTGVFRLPNSPWRFGVSPTGVRGEPAYRDEHNGEVLSELLGLTVEEIEELDGDGVLSSRGRGWRMAVLSRRSCRKRPSG